MSRVMATLFGDESDIQKPRTPPPEGVIRELVRLGVSEETARGYGARQAFAVLRKRQQMAAREPEPDPLPARGQAELRGASRLDRQMCVAELDRLASNLSIHPTAVVRSLAAALSVLTDAEARRVCRGVAKVIRETEEQLP